MGNNKLKIAGFTTLAAGVITAILTISSSINNNFIYLTGVDTSDYTITLNSENKVTSDGYHEIKTDKGKYDVTFEYSNVMSSTSGHVTLGSNGTLLNVDHIRSIENITCTFDVAASLSFKVSYDGLTWGSETTMTSGYRYDLGTAPYFLHINASEEVTISELKIGYSCLVNPAAHEGEDIGDGLLGVIDFWNPSNASDGQTATAVDEDYINSKSSDDGERDAKTLVSEVYASNAYQDRYGGIGLSSGKKSGSLSLTLASGVEPQKVVIVAGSQAPTRSLSLNSQAKDVTANCTGITTLNDTYTNTLEWNFSTPVTELTFDCSKSSKMAIYQIYLYGVGGPTFDEPEDEIIGFGAYDSKASTYTHLDTFDVDNGLSVYANKMGDTTVPLSKGGENGYSYVVKDSNNSVIDTSKPFGTEGDYTLTVSYKNYIPVVIELHVGFKVLLTNIEVNSDTLIFNTAQKLSDFTDGIKVNLTYNKSSYNQTNVGYASFAENGVTLSLVNPSNVVTPITDLFAVAGTWKIKVASIEDATTYGLLDITVNAIQVQTISVSGTSASLEAGSTLQLTVAVTPNNATNKSILWSSSKNSVATVDQNGLVTGVSAGEVRITATAKDGSSIQGYIDLTVVAAPVSLDPYTVSFVATGSDSSTEIANTTSLLAQVDSGSDYISSASGMSKIYAGTDGLKLGSSKAGGTLTLSFNSTKVKDKITSLEVTIAAYSSDSTAYTVSVNGGSSLSGTGTGNTKTYALDSSGVSLNSISFSTTKRIYLVEFKLNRAGAVAPVYPTAITLTGTSALSVGGTSQLTVGYTPSTTNVQEVTFSSSDPSVATVSATGVVTALKNGSTVITATANAGNNTTVSDTLTINVSNVAVTSVTLNQSSVSLEVGKTSQLTATVNPSNATNKAVSWSSDNTSVASISDGLITAVGVGSTTVRVLTSDGNKTATCSVTVTKAAEKTYSISYLDLPTSYQTSSTVYTASSGIKFNAYNCANYSSKVQFKASSGYIQTTEALELQTVTINDRESNTLTVYGSNTAGSFSNEITGSNDVYNLQGYSYFKIAREGSGAGYCSSITVTTGTPEPVNPTSISIDPSSVELTKGGTKTLSVNYTPSNANQNKQVTWTSSNTSVATVSTAGVVSVNSNASVGQTATITATLTNLTSIKATCVVTVVESKNDDQTILIYLCGSDLESGNGFATSDITEILSVSNQPDDVNVVIETGGAKSWSSTYGISSNILTRYHVENKSLVKDSELSNANMGSTSTLQSFLTWGIQTYPADRISLILWNHGGAMHGVCYDEKNGSDSLLNSEVKQAVGNTFTALGRSTSDKLEWIGYDACLMQVQDIADFNSQYFNYMVASEESEAGYGWDYDTWLDDAYAKKPTQTILTAIVDGFIADTNKLYSQNHWGASDQTLSWLNLSYMSAYKTAWEAMASSINSLISSYGANNFRSLMKTCKYYGSDDECEGYSYFGIFDALDVLNKIGAKSDFSGASTQISNAKTAFNNLVGHSNKGSGAGNSNGLCCYFPMTDNSGYTCSTSKYYTSSQTNFTNWRSIVTTYGQG